MVVYFCFLNALGTYDYASVLLAGKSLGVPVESPMEIEAYYRLHRGLML